MTIKQRVLDLLERAWTEERALLERLTEEEAERYLREGLEEDCRRSGCLPGWLR